MQQFNKFSKSIIPSSYANRLLVNQLSFPCNFFFFFWFDSECRVQDTVCLANKNPLCRGKNSEDKFLFGEQSFFLIKIHVRAA